MVVRLEINILAGTAWSLLNPHGGLLEPMRELVAMTMDPGLEIDITLLLGLQLCLT